MYTKGLLLILMMVVVLFIPSCGHDQTLESISVSPATVTYQGIGASAQYTALGSYIHPPETKDITNQVVWSVDIGNALNLTSTGSATAINTCGIGQVTATFYSNAADHSKGTVVVGSSSFTIGSTGGICP
jgi:hypothetical protein